MIHWVTNESKDSFNSEITGSAQDVLRVPSILEQHAASSPQVELYSTNP